MKVATPIRSRRNRRTFVAALLSYLMLAGQVAPLALAAARPNSAAPPSKAEATVPVPGVESPRAAAAPAPLLPPAPNIVATKTAAITTDADADGKADPGVDTITYTVNVTNNGAADATAVQFNDTVDTHTTLVSGSAIVAAGDSYNTIADVQISVPTNQGLLANDFNPDTGNNTGMTATAETKSSANCASCNNVTINSDGSFTFDPKVGDTATDTFTYTVHSGGSTATATAKITIAGRIWFINNNAGACTTNCDGRLSHPFQTLAAFQAVNGDGAAGHPQDGDSVFLYESAVPYVGPVTLRTNQKFIGQDATASLITITGLTQPSGTDPLPAMAPANGTIVNITSLSNAINLGTGVSNANLLRGFTVSTTTGTKISGSGFGTLTAGNSASPDVSLSGTGQALSLTNGTFANTSGFIGVGSSSSGSTGITLNNVSVAGGGAVSFGSTSISSPSAQGIFVTNCTTANSCSGTIAFGNTTVTGGTDGVSFTNNNAGTRTFGTLGVSGGSGNAFKHTKGANSTGGGNVTVNGLATLSTTTGLDPIEIADVANGTSINFAGGASVTKSSAGGEGVHWSGTNTGATLTFNSLTVQTNAGTGLNLAGGGTINVTNNTGTVNNTTQAAPAIIANGLALNANFSAINSSGGTNGVSLTNVTGTSNFGTGAISNNSGDSFFVSGGTISLTFNGTIASGSAHSVNVSGMTGGGVTFGGAITDTDTGIFLNNNTGATFNFNGGISANTATADAFTATAGGTVNVTGTNTITNTTGKAVNIANTTIGGSGVTFQSINHNASNTGTNSAIILNTTGSGTFTVTGTGTTAGTGGTIQNIQGADAVSLNTTGGLVTLKNMIIQDITASGDAGAANDTRSGVDAIQGQTVNGGLTLNNVTIQRISDDGVNGSVNGAAPTATVFNGLTITNCTITNTNRFNVAGHADAQAEAAVYIFGIKGTVSVTGSTFSNAGSGLDLTTDTTGSLDMTVTGNTFSTLYKEPGGTASVGNYGISVLQEGSLTSVVRIGDKNDANAALGNTFTNGGRLAAIRVVTDPPSSGTMKAEINRNTSTVTDHSTPGVPAGSTNYNFPQGGVLLRARGSGNYEAIFGHNTLDQVMHADGGIGQLTILAEKGTSEFIVQNNTFKLPWDAPVQIIGDGAAAPGTQIAEVKLTSNTYVTGTVGDGTTDLGGPSPFDPFYSQARNNGRLDLTIQNEATAFPPNDPSSGFSHAFYSQTTTSGDTFNLFLQNTTSSTGYELKASASTTFNLFRNGSVQGTAQGVLNDNGNSGTAFLTGAGTVTLSNTAPTLPNITIALFRPEQTNQREYLARTNTAPAETSGTDAAQAVAFAGAASSADTLPSLRERLDEVIPSERAGSNTLELSKRGAAFSHSASDSSAPLVNGMVAAVEGVAASSALSPNPVAATAAATFAGCSPSGISGGHLCADLGTIKAGDTVQITFQVTVNNLPNLDAADLAGGAHVSNQGTVSYTGFPSVLTDDPSLGGASDPTKTPVDLFHSTTTLVSDVNPSDNGQQVTFTATVAFDTAEVSPTPATPTTPTGTVQFFDGANPITCTNGNTSTQTLSGGQAQCQTSTLTTPVGSPHSITAVYSGDGNYNTSTSNTVSQTVNNCQTNITVTSTADSGANTLRQAITDVCVSGTINFNVPDDSTITLTMGELAVGKSMNIVGPANRLTVSGNNSSRVFNVSTGTVAISNLTVSGGGATGDGGGLLNSGATLTLTGMLFTGNTATGDGGGVASTGGTLNVRNTTINGNTANDGGGLFNSGGTANLVNDTISANNASGVGGGLRQGNTGTFNVVNTIVAGNSATTSDPDASGTFASGGHNLVGKSDGSTGFNATGDQTGSIATPLDPQLGTLQNNGGPTQTRALLPASPAIEAGDNTAANTAGLTTDQRGTGFPRIADSADADTTQTVDIGAFELHPSVEDITDKSTPEDTTLAVTFNIGDGTGALISSVAGTSNNQTLAPDGNISVTGSGSTRTIHITPASNANTPSDGTATITVTVTATNGRTATDTFVLTVTEVNDAPTANNDTVTDILEDSGVYSIPFSTLTGNDSKGPANESGQALTITQVGNATGGSVGINGTNVEFTPTANFNGPAGFDYTVQDNGTTNGSPDFKTSTAHVSFNVTAVNDAPSFTKGADQTVNEDAGAQTVNNWATNISAGPADESGQTLTFNVTGNDNTALFSTQPAVSSAGTLTYTPAANAFGTANITLTLSDNGGTANGGSDTSAPQSFMITVGAVADTPSVTPATTLEDTQSTSGLVISRNAADSSEVTHFKITNILHGTLFQNDGTTPINSGTFITFAEGNAGLKFTPAADFNGTANFDVQGSIDNSGTGLSSAATANITVTAVNDAPSFMKGPDQTVPINSGSHTVNNWATNISAGPADESGQTLNFIVTNDNNPLFSSQPAVSSAGTLTYTPAANMFGQATVSVSLHDNGGTANGGQDTSAVQTFTITVGMPSLKVLDAKAAEPSSGTSKMLFTVVLSPALATQTVTVDYATADDTGGAHPATSGTCGSPGVDYEATSGTLTFNPGETLKTVSVTICADGGGGPDETLLLNLSNAPSATLSRAQAVGTITQTNPPGTFLISELRTSGPGGLGDDFVELYNNTDSPLTVTASDASGGYGLFKMGASCTDTPVLVAQIPNNTVIPARGHYLLVGSQYSLSAYAAGDQTLTSDIESDRNVAVFSTSDVGNLSTVTRLDAVGFGANFDSSPVSSEADATSPLSRKHMRVSVSTDTPLPPGGGVCDLFREGTNLPAASGSALEYSFFRKECDFQGAACTTAGVPKDTNDNSADFMFADTQGTSTPMGQHLGAPGPENKNSPIRRDATIPVSLLDNTKANSALPNRFRAPTDIPNPTVAPFGSLYIRRRVQNNTGGDVARLRFRIVEITTLPNGAGDADLRAITSSDVPVSNVHDTTTCLDKTAGSASDCTVTVKGTLLEQPPNQSFGGGYNSTLSVDLSGLPGGKLAAGASTEVQFQLGVVQSGRFRILVIVEALP